MSPMSPTSPTPPLFRPAALTAAACTTVQAAAWLALGLLGMFTANNALGPTIEDLANTSENLQATDLFQLTLIGCYFPRDGLNSCCTTDLIMREDGMVIASVMILVHSFLWLMFSILLFIELWNKTRHANALVIMWATDTVAIALMDAIVVILFGIDYAKISSQCSSDPSLLIDGSISLSVTGMLMTLSARGYVLWVLNVAAALLIGLPASRMHEAARKKLGPYGDRHSMEKVSRRSSVSSGSTAFTDIEDGIQDKVVATGSRHRSWPPAFFAEAGGPPATSTTAGEVPTTVDTTAEAPVDTTALNTTQPPVIVLSLTGNDKIGVSVL